MLAKWKLDQQIRLNNSQTQEKQLQGQLGISKMELANQAFQLFKDKKLSDEALNLICQKLVIIEENLQDQMEKTKLIKDEKPPASEMVIEGQKQQLSDSASPTGLICPKCRKSIPVKYCPDCGQEGIPIK